MTNQDNIKDLKKDNKIPTEETVEVKKSFLDEMELRMKRLEQSANKARLFNFDRANQEDLSTVIRLRTLDGKIITSWETVSDTVYRDPVSKRLVEDQKVKVYFEDGESDELDISTFAKRFVHIKTKVIEAVDLKKQEDINKYGSQKFKLETEDGKELVIGANFVN